MTSESEIRSVQCYRCGAMTPEPGYLRKGCSACGELSPTPPSAEAIQQKLIEEIATLTAERDEARELLRELWTAMAPGVINQDRDWVRSIREIVEGK